MSYYTITVKPHGSLFIGGYSQASGASDGDTATGPAGPFIPGSTIKGALRESAARLVKARGQQQQDKEVFNRLFGNEGHEGLIRIGPLQPILDSDQDVVDLSVRNHVSLDRARRQAAPGRLFQNRVSPAGHDLRFAGQLATAEVLTEDETLLLEGAVSITDQIGGGRGRGLGLVEIKLVRSEAPARTVTFTPLKQRATVTLVLQAEEPLQLGLVKDLSNLAQSKGCLDGSAVRGAVAKALSHVSTASKEALDDLLGGASPAWFGDGHAGHECAIPAPLTLREKKAGGPAVDVAAQLCAAKLTDRLFDRQRDTRPIRGTVAPGLGRWSKVFLKRRIVTRTARNHLNGRAAEAMLHSLEVVDPCLESPLVADHRNLLYFVPVTGSPQQLELVVDAAATGLVVGRGRSRGFGRLSLVEVVTEPTLPDIDQRHDDWCQRLSKLGVDDPARAGVLLALGPLAVDQGRLLRGLATARLELVTGVSRRQAGGGWNAAARVPRTVASHLVPGSVLIVRSQDRGSARARLAAIESEGIGPGRPDGWGAVIACHPIHIDCCKSKEA